MYMGGAIITAISTILGALISGIVAVVVAGKQSDKTIALVEYRLNKLEEKMDKHNNLVERVTILEQNDKAQWKHIDQFKDKL